MARKSLFSVCAFFLMATSLMAQDWQKVPLDIGPYNPEVSLDIAPDALAGSSIDMTAVAPAGQLYGVLVALQPFAGLDDGLAGVLYVGVMPPLGAEVLTVTVPDFLRQTKVYLRTVHLNDAGQLFYGAMSTVAVL